MPAAAVIPAPIAYIKVVAVKKLVVGLFAGCGDCAFGRRSSAFCICSVSLCGVRAFYFEKIRVFQAGSS